VDLPPSPDPFEAAAVAVVVPAYQADAYLPAALDSLLAQTRTDWAAVVVDDGSSDATAQVAQGYADRDARIRLVRKENGGVSAARNSGLAALPTAARWVAFLDADDVYRPHALESLTAVFAADPDAEAVHALTETVDVDGELLDEGTWPAFQRGRVALNRGGRGWVPLPTWALTTYDSVLHDWRGFPTAVLMVRRDVVDAVGGFDERFALSEDWDYVRRLARRRPLVFLDEVVGHYRRHGTNTTLDADLVRRSAREFYRTALGDPSDDPATRALGRLAWRALQVEAGTAAAGRWVASARDRRPVGVARESAAVGLHALRWLRGGPSAAAGRAPVATP